MAGEKSEKKEYKNEDYAKRQQKQWEKKGYKVTRLFDLSVPIEQVNYLAGHKSMAMTKCYDHANEERYGGAIEALDEAGKTGSAEALAAARWNQR